MQALVPQGRWVEFCVVGAGFSDYFDWYGFPPDAGSGRWIILENGFYVRKFLQTNFKEIISFCVPRDLACRRFICDNHACVSARVDCFSWMRLFA
jgi:hypothetical protein